MKNKLIQATVTWKDAVIYTAESKLPLKLPVITTHGTIIKKTPYFVLLKNTKSTSDSRNWTHQKDSASFFFIPKHMIISITTNNRS